MAMEAKKITMMDGETIEGRLYIYVENEGIIRVGVNDPTAHLILMNHAIKKIEV